MRPLTPFAGCEEGRASACQIYGVGEAPSRVVKFRVCDIGVAGHGGEICVTDVLSDQARSPVASRSLSSALTDENLAT
jgi:hypothetical protein